MTEQEYLNKLTEDENFFREEFSYVFKAIEEYKKGKTDDIESQNTPCAYWYTKSNYRFDVNSGKILAENEGKWGDGLLIMLCCSFNEDDKDMEDEDGRLYNAYITCWEEGTFWEEDIKNHEYNIGDSLAPVPDWFVKYLCDADEIHRENVKDNDYPAPGED